jgi:Arylsulfatase A and related enzymes
MRDRAVAWLKTQKTVYPDKPVFMYYAPGATHAPHHVFDEWTRPYKGRFDKGWNALRQEIYENQKHLGVIPEDTVLNPMSPGIPAWETLTEDERRLHARMMEVYAGFLAQTDHCIGEVVDAFKELGLYDNTLVFYIQGDNGASAEAHMGAINEIVGLINALPDEFAVNEELIASMGGPESFSNYAAGWATALCAPFQWSKEIASHYGGTRNGMVVSWPRRYGNESGSLRSQWHHVVDIAPTLLEATGLTMPAMVNGVAQKPLEGVSMLYCLDDPEAKFRRKSQYFETMGNAAYYYDGWVAATKVRMAPWKQFFSKVGESPATWEWELYEVKNDFSQSANLAAEHPDKLREMQMLFFAEAGRRNVLPLSDDPFSAMGAAYLDRRKEWTFSQGFGRLPEGAAPIFRNRSYIIQADVHVSENSEASGMLYTLGGQFGGLALFIEKGKPVFIYNYLAIETFEIDGTDPLTAGDHTVEVAFTYDGGEGIGKGGSFEMRVDGKTVAEGRIERSVPRGFSLGDSMDVGFDTGTPIVPDRYVLPFAYTDKLRSVHVRLE